jgi:hypothetical protein
MTTAIMCTPRTTAIVDVMQSTHVAKTAIGPDD